jgi:hypothetical protein
MEGLKLEAYKEARVEQRENQDKLRGKVETVSKKRDELQKANSAAREALGKLKFTKAQMAKLEEEFENMLEDEAVKKYLERRNITTMDEYITAEGIEKTQSVKSYESLSASLAGLKTELESKVQARAEVKQDLKGELDQNDPGKAYENLGNPPRSSYDRFNQAALEQGKKIEDNEISALVDEVLTGRKEIIEDYVQKYATGTRGPEIGDIRFVTENDIARLQKYGEHGGYYQKALNLFVTRVNEIIRSVDPKYRQYLEMIFSSHLSSATNRVSADNREVDKVVQNEYNAKRLEVLLPEIETTFSELEDKINQNPFRDLVKGFKSYGNQGVYVEFVVASDPNSLSAKYFNYPNRSSSTASPLSEFSQSGLEDTLKTVDFDLHETEEEKRKGRESKDRFAARSWLSRTFNKQDGLNISRRLARSESNMYNLGKIKELQEGLLAFIVKIKSLNEREGLIKPELGVGREGALQLSDFKEQYLEKLKKQFA